MNAALIRARLAEQREARARMEGLTVAIICSGLTFSIALLVIGSLK